MTALQRVSATLDHHGIPHALIGAAALAARGIARSTFDIDLLTTELRALESGLWSPLIADGIGVEIRRGDLDDPLAGVVRVTPPEGRPVDVVVGRHSWQARAVERAESVGDGPSVVLSRDLVLLKLYAGGSQDLWDVRELLQHDDGSLVRAVSADVAVLSSELRQRWGAWQQ